MGPERVSDASAPTVGIASTTRPGACVMAKVRAHVTRSLAANRSMVVGFVPIVNTASPDNTSMMCLRL